MKLLGASMSTIFKEYLSAANCIDKDWSTYCLTQREVGKSQWLKISFSPTTVDKVQLFNRINLDRPEVSKRINDTEVTLWSGVDQVKSCGTLTYIPDANLPSQSYLIDCGSNQLADTVQIQAATGKHLNYFEVFVLTKTPPDQALTCSEIRDRKAYYNLPLGGLRDGNVFTILMFYGSKGDFFISLLASNKSIPLHIEYREESDQQYTLVSYDGSTWKGHTKMKGTIAHNMMLEVKINVTRGCYKVTINDVVLPDFPHSQDMRGVTKLELSLGDEGSDAGTTLYSVALQGMWNLIFKSI